MRMPLASRHIQVMLLMVCSERHDTEKTDSAQLFQGFTVIDCNLKDRTIIGHGCLGVHAEVRSQDAGMGRHHRLNGTHRSPFTGNTEHN